MLVTFIENADAGLAIVGSRDFPVHPGEKTLAFYCGTIAPHVAGLVHQQEIAAEKMVTQLMVRDDTSQLAPIELFWNGVAVLSFPYRFLANEEPVPDEATLFALLEDDLPSAAVTGARSEGFVDR